MVTENFLIRLSQPTNFINKMLDIIPRFLPSHLKKKDSDFTRVSKLPFSKLIVFILSISASGKSKGVDTKSGEFFKNARRSGLWPEAYAIHRSTLTKARKNVDWHIFQDMLRKAVDLAYEIWPSSSKYLWRGMSVYATDGSKYDLPATEEIRKKFDPNSGLQFSGKGHYPQCLVSTLYDVFRRLPVARTVVGVNGSEREEVKNLVPFIPPHNVWLFDRGYPSYELIQYLEQHYDGYFLFRCPASSTFPAVESFIKSCKQEDVIFITPSNKFLNKVGAKERKKFNPVKLRVIKLVSPEGTVSVLLTNLFDNKQFPVHEVIALYSKRWEVESHYRDEKVVLEIEQFHSKTVNGILQEIFSSMIMSVISRTLIILSTELLHPGTQGLQFKNTIMTLASEAAILVPYDPLSAVEIFDEILTEISRVKYYRPKKSRPSQPRICKKPINKWCINKSKGVI